MALTGIPPKIRESPARSPLNEKQTVQMKYVVDTNIINKLVDGIVTADELPHDGAFVATHVQKDEIERTKDPKRRSDLLKKFSETIDDMIPTSSFVLVRIPVKLNADSGRT